MTKTPIKTFYYGIVKDTKDFMQYLGRDDNSGGYPYLTPYPQIFYDTRYLEEHRIDTHLRSLVDGGDYTLTIYEVNPFYNTVTEV